MKSTTTVESIYISGFCSYLEEKGRQPPTIESYAHDANQFLDYLAKLQILPNRVEAEQLIQYQDYLSSELHEGINTVRRAVIGVRQFYRYLVAQNVLRESPFEEVAIPDRRELLPQVDYEKLSDLIASICSDSASTFFAARNGAIMACLGLEGIKATELIAMQWTDIIADTIHIRGGRARTIQISPETNTALQRYRLAFETLCRERSVELKNVFVAFKGRDAAVLIPKMSRHGLKFIIYELGERYKFNHLNSEILRHHAVNLLLHSGRSSEEVMAHLGLRRPGNIARHIAKDRHQSAD